MEANTMVGHRLGQFYENFSSWRRALARATPESQPGVFADAAADAAGCIERGLDKITAVDELVDMAASIGWDDADAVQKILSDALKVRSEPTAVDWDSLRDEYPDDDGEPGAQLQRLADAGPSLLEDNVVPLRSEQTNKQRYNGGERPLERPAPLPFIDMSRWDDEDPPPREWAVQDRYPLGQTSLFGGEGATGKSILELQRAFAHTLGRDWLQTLPRPGPAIFIDTEDDANEMHHRAKKIVVHYGATIRDAVQGGLHLLSFAGEDAVMATASHNGKIEPTSLYHRLLQAAGDIKPVMISIASSANIFAGNEIDRSQVQQFVGMLTKIAIVAHGGLTLIAHPSLAGINSDTGLSGSTQWHNAVRARSYLKGVKAENNEGPDQGLREIVFKKNNYGPVSASLVLRFQDGLFLPVPGAGAFEQIAREAKAEEIFLTLLGRFTRVNRMVSDRPSANYAPALFAKEEEAKKAALSSAHLAAAMRELFKNNKIWNEQYGRPSRPRYRVMIKEPETSSHE